MAAPAWRRSCPADPRPENDITDLAAETLQYVALERNHHLKSRAGLKPFTNAEREDHDIRPKSNTTSQEQQWIDDGCAGCAAIDDFDRELFVPQKLPKGKGQRTILVHN